MAHFASWLVYATSLMTEDVVLTTSPAIAVAFFRSGLIDYGMRMLNSLLIGLGVFIAI